MNTKVIHLAGSKGKGTAAWLIAEGLKESGKRVGLFTSPFILERNEMIRVDGKEIRDDELERLLKEVNSEDEMSDFEAMTAAAFKYFDEKECEFAVLECGWGGKRDATNLAENKVLTLLAHVELEHTEVLGSSLKEITEEKLGICKPGVPLIMVPNQEAEVLDTVQSSGIPFELAPAEELGYHHSESAGLALYALEKLGIVLTEDLRDKLERLQVPGVFERFAFYDHQVILDGAHTYDSIRSLEQRVLDYAQDNGLPMPIYAVHTLKDKPADLWTLFPRDRTVWVELNHERAGKAPSALPLTDVERFFKELKLDEVPRLIIFAGSFRLVAAVKRAL